MNIIEGKLDARGIRVAVVVARFNEFITSKLLGGAIDCLKRNNAEDDKITVVWVPGSFEIPSMAKRLVESNQFDTVICLGAVIRGGTPHFEYVSAEVSKGVANVAITSNIPVIYGVITTDSIEQAIERAGTKSGNKGADAAFSAIEMVNLFKQIN